ncbi:MAG: hypothetical protein SVW77_01015, partial [Candidatus Nanohaloarchaea archaeon]|nr:hypothetical protein [Candidatus Nanohaloarchaea archaeon]
MSQVSRREGDFPAVDASLHSEEAVEAALEEDGTAGLERLSGGYALAWRDGDDVVLARDLLGIKPLFYTLEPFAFASQKESLEGGKELHPRQILRYDTAAEEARFEQRPFFDVDEQERAVEDAADEVVDLLLTAVDRRVDEPAALLFSGGL